MTSPPAREPVCSHCLAHGERTPVAWHLPDNQCCPACGCAYSDPPRHAAYRALVDAGLVDDVHRPGETGRNEPERPADQAKTAANTTPKVVKGIA